MPKRKAFKRGPLTQKKSKPDEIKKLPTVKAISLKEITPGMNFLGIIKKVSRIGALVSLTGCLTGHIPLSDFVADNAENNKGKAARELNQILRSRVVSCVVTRVVSAPYPKVCLTILPQSTNAGILKSSVFDKNSVVQCVILGREETGCLVDIGDQSQTCFLSCSDKKLSKYVLGIRKLKQKTIKTNGKKDSETKGNKQRSFKVDSFDFEQYRIPCWGKIRKFVKNAVRLKLVRKFIKCKSVGDFDKITSGICVDSTVIERYANGIKVLFFGIFYGLIDTQNAEKNVSSYKIGEKLLAIVVFVDYESKKVLLSDKSHLVENIRANKLSPYTNALVDKGTIFPEAEITSVDRSKGVFLDIRYEEKVIKGFCHFAKLSDKEKSKNKLMSTFPRGLKIKCRAYDFSEISDLVLVTAKESLISQNIFKIEDLTVGSFVEGCLLSFEKYGLLLNLTPAFQKEERTLKGVVSNEHMADYQIQDPKKKFQLGQKLMCQVLSVEFDTNRVFLTMKKTFMNSDLNKITDYFPDINLITYGSIASIFDNGIYLNFYNGVFGFLPGDEIKRAGYKESLKEIFYIGQSLKVRVDRVKPSKEKDNFLPSNHTALKSRIFLSLELDKKSLENQDWSFDQTDNASEFFSVGSIVQGSVKLVLDNKIFLFLQQDKDKKKKVIGELFSSHLSDFNENCEILHKELRVGQVLENLVVVCIKENGNAVLSKKFSLFNIAKIGQCSSYYTELKENSLQIGTVIKIVSKGLVIGFFGSLTAFCSKAHTPANTENFDDAYQIGNTVLVSILKSSNDKIFCSMKESDVVPHLDKKTIETHSVNFFFELDKIIESSLKPIKNRENIKIGNTFKGKILELTCTEFLAKIEVESFIQENNISCFVVDTFEKEKNLLNFGDEIEIELIDILFLENNNIRLIFILAPDMKKKNNDEKYEVIHKEKHYSILKNTKTHKNFFSLNSLFGIPLITDDLSFEATPIPNESKLNRNIAIIKTKSNDLTKANQVQMDRDKHTLLEGIIVGANNSGLKVEISDSNKTKGFVHFSEISSSLSILNSFDRYLSAIQDSNGKNNDTAFPFVMGTKHKFCVTKQKQNLFMLSLRHAKICCATSGADSLSDDDDSLWTVGRVVRVQDVWVEVEVGINSYGRIHITTLEKTWRDFPMKKIEQGSYIKVTNGDFLLKNNAAKNINWLSRYSLMSCVTSKDIYNSIYHNQLTYEITENQIVWGFVKRVDKQNGVFVTLSPANDALVYKKDVADGFVQDINEYLHENKLIQGRVMAVENGRARLSLKKSDLLNEEVSFEDFEEGQIVSGVIESVRPFGIFARLKGSRVSALCHIKQLSNPENLDLEKLLKKYEKIVSAEEQFRVLKIDKDKRRISLTMNLNNDKKKTLKETKTNGETVNDGTISHVEIDTNLVQALLKAENERFNNAEENILADQSIKKLKIKKVNGTQNEVTADLSVFCETK